MHKYDLFTLIHSPHWKYKNLNNLLLNSAMRTMAVALVGIYVPIYILEISIAHNPMYKINQHMLIVVAYYAIIWVSEVAVNYHVAKTVTKIGLRASVVIANALLVIHFLLLIYSENHYEALFLSPVIMGVMMAFYWIPHHFVFTEKFTSGEVAEDMSMMLASQKIGSIMAPFIGGLVVTQFGFPALYILALNIVILSTIPILRVNINFKMELKSLSESIKDFINKGEGGFYYQALTYINQGAEGHIHVIFWPIFIFTVVENFETLGLIVSIALLMSTIVALVLGKWIDKHRKDSIIKIGGYGNSFLWLVRVFATTSLRVLSVDFLYQVIRIFLTFPVDSYFYMDARGKNTYEKIVCREYAFNIGRILLSVVMIILLFSGLHWLYVFGLGALFSLISVFVFLRGSKVVVSKHI